MTMGKDIKLQLSIKNRVGKELHEKQPLIKGLKDETHIICKGRLL